MTRFIAALIIGTLTAALTVVAYYAYFTITVQFGGDAAPKTAMDFDFAGYCFGIVAVAIAFSGVYISVVPGGCSGQLLEITYKHLTPSPFGEKDLVKEMVHPESKLHNLIRTEAVKCIHAVITLSNWEILEPQDRNELLGVEGLSAFRSGFGKHYRFFQNQIDRLIITIISISVSLIYVLLPVAYFKHSERMAESMLSVVYYLSILNMFVCLLMYAIRHLFVHRYELRMGPWKVELANFITSRVETVHADFDALNEHIKTQVALQVSKLGPT